MKVAALYDIHGNLPALEAVLAEVRREGVDQVVVGGDVVPGPLPGQTLQALLDLDLPVRFLAGNGEHDVLAAHAGRALDRVPRAVHETLRWTADTLTPAQLEALAAWPDTVRMTVDGLGTVLFCHATPADDIRIFTRLTPEERLRPVFSGVDADLVVCGHTHMPFDRTVGPMRVVNAGSVGMPFGEPGAWWLLLGPEVEVRHTPYDLEAAARRLSASSCPPAGRFDPRRPPAAADMLARFEKAAQA